MGLESDAKICGACGREFAWRRKWARSWAQVRYCSERCRRQRAGRNDRALEASIVELLRARDRKATICPSEAARDVAPASWRPLMEPARAAARRLAARDEVVVLQRGQPVDPSRAKGPIRLGRGPCFTDRLREGDAIG